MMFSIDGRPVSRLEDEPSTIFGVVDAHYLSTAGIPVVEGRDFSDSDRETTMPVVIVNQAFVKQYFSDVDPIGKRIELGAPASLIAQDAWMGLSARPSGSSELCAITAIRGSGCQLRRS